MQSSGVLDTPNEVTHLKRATPKNVGKANETTAEQQALLEVQSSIKEKLTEGYFKTQKEAEENEVILPMLAKDYHKEKHKIDWDFCYVQPKLDGMRCLAFIKDGIVKLMSRDGKIIQNMQHIEKELSTIKHDVILDGELYNLDLGSFQNQMKAIKKYTKDFSEKIMYNVYDIVESNNFTVRNALVNALVIEFKNVVHVETTVISNEEDLIKAHQINISNGYEGSIVRWGNDVYKVNARSSNLLKYKDFQDIALPIKDIIPAEQRPEWGKPIFELNGKEFSAGMKYSHEDRIDFLKNKSTYIGTTAEIRYFEMTDGGLPRFPTMWGIRLDK